MQIEVILHEIWPNYIKIIWSHYNIQLDGGAKKRELEVKRVLSHCKNVYAHTNIHYSNIVEWPEKDNNTLHFFPVMLW